MAIIRQLDSHVADLIAAGEVVERPASVVKELVENSIDAQAKNVIIEIENGGITYLRISDDGIGMSKEDAEIAFKRHATSKIRQEEDLACIGTLGFRGEALAAISAVSKVDLFTKENGSIEGTHIFLKGGNIEIIEPAGCPVGTSFIIKDLFYNTPARMKFLKKDFTEAGYVVSAVQKAAMSNPSISFKCIKDGKTVFSTPGNGDLFSAVYNVFGKEFATNLIKSEAHITDGIKVWGYISKPHFARSNRSMQVFFVNGRYIKSPLIQAALEESYKNKIIGGKYPFCAIDIELPYEWVDVNVHPTKTQVKFSNEKRVFEAVYGYCKKTLMFDENIPELSLSKMRKEEPVNEDNITGKQQRIEIQTQENDSDYCKKSIKQEHKRPFSTNIFKREELNQNIATVRQSPAIAPSSKANIIVNKVDVFCDVEEKPTSIVKNEEQLFERLNKPFQNKNICEDKTLNYDSVNANNSTEKKEEVKIIGECFNTYIIAEDEKGLLLVDKHAAHERLIFNQLKKTTQFPTQVLIVPEVVNLSRDEASAINEGIPEIRKIGFEIEPFGENAFIIRQVPAYLDQADIAVTISEIAEKLSNKRSVLPDRFDDIIHTVSCKAAIKGGSRTSNMEISELLNKVIYNNEVTACPHGRPVTVRLTKYELDKMFKRVNQ